MTHIVQPGETLWSIASRYGVAPQAIMRANGITNPNAISVGQRLFIPVSPGQPGQPGPQPFPPFPPFGRDLERRVSRLEQEVNRLQNEVNRLDRRIDRLER